MIPTYVFGWPTGAEVGDFLALDLGNPYHPRYSCMELILSIGGTNLRVCLVTLQGEGKFEMTQSKYRLTEEQKHEDGQKLFDFCAECLKTFIESNLTGDAAPTANRPLPLGFTVRF
jgi:hexokinase